MGMGVAQKCPKIVAEIVGHILSEFSNQRIQATCSNVNIILFLTEKVHENRKYDTRSPTNRLLKAF